MKKIFLALAIQCSALLNIIEMFIYSGHIEPNREINYPTECHRHIMTGYELETAMNCVKFANLSELVKLSASLDEHNLTWSVSNGLDMLFQTLEKGEEWLAGLDHYVYEQSFLDLMSDPLKRMVFFPDSR